MKKTFQSIGLIGCLCGGLLQSTVFGAVLYDTETLLTEPRPADGDSFGNSVDISGSDILIGAPQLEFAPLDTGFVWVYSLTGPGTNVTMQRIFSSSGAPGFSVAIDDGKAVVGIPFVETHFSAGGEAAFFQHNGSNWDLQTFVGKSNSTFGSQVAISGDTAVVLKSCDGFADCTSSLFVYVQSGSNWVEQAQLIQTGPIAISGDTLITGPGIYFRSGTNWGSLAQILIATNFLSETIDGDIAVVGAGSSVFINENVHGSWMLRQQIVPSDSVTGFGRSVDIKGTRIVVGADEAAYVFDLVGGTWVQMQKLLPLSGGTIVPHDFGASVAIGERGVVVGAPESDQVIPGDGGNGRVGAVYLFTSSAVPISITSASASPSVLWPPNHKLVPVTISVATTGSPATCRIVSVSSNQPINGTGDGNTSPDWVITGDLTVLLRAERAGNIKTNRVYTITIECADSFGNTVRQNVFVTVPHDQGH
ncbi:MAG: hypothetical protein ACXWKG_02460 [Limisphaerales bacterium]